VSQGVQLPGCRRPAGTSALGIPALHVRALILSFASDLLGWLAARTAGDDWPR
jgi:hypothetical protein